MYTYFEIETAQNIAEHVKLSIKSKDIPQECKFKQLFSLLVFAVAVKTLPTF